MSTRGKYSGLTRKKKEERQKRAVGGVEAAISSIAGQTQRFINEWSSKFNTLSTQVEAIAKQATTELGKLWGNQQQVVESIDHIDINTLAHAELNKVLFWRIAEVESRLKSLEALAETVALTEEQKDEIAKVGAAAYTEEVKKAFSTVFERRRQDYEARKAAMEKAAVDAKAAEEAKTEAEIAERALREAEQPELITSAAGGGKGADIPEGAEVFGGA